MDLIRRGGSGAEGSGDACVALEWDEGKAAGNEGDASVPTPHIIHPRPYGYEAASEAASPNTYP